MANRKRKLQEVTAHPDPVSYGKAQLIRMEELALMIVERTMVSKRLNLSFVRLEKMSYAHAETLTRLLEVEISKHVRGQTD